MVAVAEAVRQLPWQLGGSLAAAWRQLGGSLAAAWRQLGGSLAAAWWQLGSSLVEAWRQLGSSLVVADAPGVAGAAAVEAGAVSEWQRQQWHDDR